MGILTRIKIRIATWYQGAYVPPPKNDPDSRIVFIGTGFYIQPRLAQILGCIGRFLRAEWKWFFWLLFAIVGLLKFH
jgi:hypothetical protein